MILFEKMQAWGIDPEMLRGWGAASRLLSATHIVTGHKRSGMAFKWTERGRRGHISCEVRLANTGLVVKCMGSMAMLPPVSAEPGRQGVVSRHPLCSSQGQCSSYSSEGASLWCSPCPCLLCKAS